MENRFLLTTVFITETTAIDNKHVQANGNIVSFLFKINSQLYKSKETILSI